MKTLTFKAIEFKSVGEALQYYCAGEYGHRVIQLGGKAYLTTKAEADRLAAAGVEFAYAFDHDLPDGRNVIMTVPVN